MACPLKMEIESFDSETNARIGKISTPHGSFNTPVFMPVGTRGTVKGMLPSQLREVGTEILLGNAYHLMLRPTSEMIARRGGLHSFIGWNKPILTDSGGYQAWSMAGLTRLGDDGVRFKSIIDGSYIDLTPERSIQIQNQLGADIIMAFDDCPPSLSPDSMPKSIKQQGLLSRDGTLSHKKARLRLIEANERTARWLERGIKAHSRKDDQALFGIIQGGTDLDLRKESIDAICSISCPGYAIGGVAVGESPEDIRKVVDWCAPKLPSDKPRYLMGVGYEQNLLDSVMAGVDMFDCVLPTRNGRNGRAFTKSGVLSIRNACFKEDDGPLDPLANSPVDLAGFTRSYIRHLFMAGEMLGPILLTLHNLAHFHGLMVDIRTAIRDNDWSSFFDSWPVLVDRRACASFQP